MRSALLLLGGLVLLGAGIAVIALGVPGGWVFGPGLIVAGLLVKVAGFLLTDDAPGTPGGSGRTVTTLGPAGERPRSATAAGRTTARRRPRWARTARASEAARAAALSPATGRRGPGRRAS
jgi:hypothetical protein